MAFSAAMTVFWCLLGVGMAVLLMSLLCHRFVKVTMTVWVFALGAVLLYPWVQAVFASLGPVKQALLAAYHTLRLFILDGDYQAFLQSLPAQGVPESYPSAMLAVYFAAPITTVTMIASCFENVTAWLRLHTVSRLTGLSIFSELNPKSLALARSIRDAHPLRTVVFYDVYRNDTEQQTELLEEARKLGTLCFRKDILHMKLRLFAGVKEYFILGANESENISQAMQLAEEKHTRRNVHIYVWAHGPESTCIFDSLNLYEGEKGVRAVTDPKGFKLRRVDDMERFTWKTLREAKLFDPQTCVADGQDKRLSILIVGMGDYGISFLKTALWMYQRDDVQLEITAVDSRTGIREKILHQCPELETMNDRHVPGESRYSIRFLENTDIFSHSFDRMVLEDLTEMAQRLRRTTAVFVTLGDDDTNIRASMELRQLFDRVSFARELEKAKQANGSGAQVGAAMKKSAGKQAVPMICSPVYDIRKTQNVTGKGLRTYGDTPYNIRFLGSFSQQYSYETVTRETLEKQALAYHLQWVSKETDLPENIIAYGQYEYCRRSSMAQAIHKEMLLEAIPDPCTGTAKTYSADEQKVNRQHPGVVPLKQEQTCKCSVCVRRRQTEHMRWNAYMRTEGYCAPPADRAYKIKLHRAKYHCDLVTYDKLDELTQLKDSSLVK